MLDLLSQSTPQSITDHIIDHYALYCSELLFDNWFKFFSKIISLKI